MRQIVGIARKVKPLAIEDFCRNREAVIGKRAFANLGAAMSIAGVKYKNIALLYAQELSIEDKLTLALTNDAEDVMVISVICERLQDATICSAFSLEKGKRLDGARSIHARSFLSRTG